MTEERERKRQRKLPSPASFLSALCEEAVQNILRFTSARPRSVHWQGYVKPSDVLSILRSGGPLAEVVRREFVVLRKNNFCNPSCARFVKNISADVFKDILLELGPFEHSISETICTRRIRTCFTELNELHLNTIVLNGFSQLDETWFLQVCSAELRTLRLIGNALRKNVVKGIERYCGGLQTLMLCFEECEEPLRGVWVTVGPTLEDLTFKIPTRNSRGVKQFDARTMRKYCVSLTRLEVIGSPTRNREDRTARAVGICQAFGPQLQVLRMLGSRDCFPPKYLKAVFKKCPNVVVDAYVHHSPVQTLLTLGKRLRTLHMLSKEGLGYEQAGAGAMNLEELFLHIVESRDGRFLSRLLAVPKPFLRKVRLDLCIPLIYSRTVLDKLAELSTTIEVIEITASTFFSKRDFRKLTVANQNMRSVSVFVLQAPFQELEVQKCAEAVAVGFMEDIAQCPLIEEVVIENSCLNWKSAQIAEACLPLRGKSTDVFIGGISYRI